MRKGIAEELVLDNIPYGRLVSFINDVSALVETGYDERRFSEAMASPNSAIVPWEQITGVRRGRNWHQGGLNYVTITASGEQFILLQDPMCEAPMASLCRLVSGRWQNVFVETLEQAAAGKGIACAQQLA